MRRKSKKWKIIYELNIAGKRKREKTGESSTVKTGKNIIIGMDGELPR